MSDTNPTSLFEMACLILLWATLNNLVALGFIIWFLQTGLPRLVGDRSTEDNT